MFRGERTVISVARERYSQGGANGTWEPENGIVGV